MIKNQFLSFNKLLLSEYEVCNSFKLFSLNGCFKYSLYKAFSSLLSCADLTALFLSISYNPSARLFLISSSFGIADKVLKQLKVQYPELADGNYSNGVYLGMMYQNGLISMLM